MQPDDINLLEHLDSAADAGTLFFKNRRLLLVDADALGFFRKELIGSLGVEAALRILARFGFAQGYRDALTAKEMSDWRTPEAWWRAGLRFTAAEGLVGSRVLSLRHGEETKSFEVEIEWLGSFEVEQHLKHLGTSDIPVCWTLVGYAGGYSSAVFGTNVFFFETECLGKGDARCRVIGRSTDKLADAAEVAVQHYRIKDFTNRMPKIITERAELQTLMLELERRSLDLASEQEKVRSLESQVFYLQESIKENYNLEELVGTSRGFKQVMGDVEKVAASDSTVLLTGETGTGKELIARAIHARSRRRQRPLVTVNCAALPAGLVESELFGHEKGAFTGAIQRKLGRFELASGATIFLDEVGELSLETQAKFLRVLQQGEFERVGGAQTIRVDVRVIAATNRPLKTLVDEGKYRADLYYRLNVFPIEIPPLRERREDIILLTNYFAQKYRARFKKNIRSISQDSLEQLQRYAWPGNVRELEHIVERAVLLSEGEVLRIDLPASQTAAAPLAPDGRADKLVPLDEMERDYIQQVLRHTGGLIAGKGGAADILDLPPSTLRSRMKKLGIK